MKVYELKLQKGGKGVFKMSTVKNPAIDNTLLFFKKEDKDILLFTDEEKRIFYAPAMIPNKMIFRKDINGEPAEVFYKEDFIEESQINYFRNNGNKENNINHAEENVEGLFPFESWIVKNSKTDKATELGFNVPDGTWMMAYKVDNDDVWKDVKEGKLDGLSIEATNLDRILKDNIEMKKEDSKKSVMSFIKEGLDNLFKDAEKMEGQVAEVSKWWQTVVNDTFAIGDTVERKPHKDSDEDPKPVGAGEFELEDGRRILTDSEGIIRHIFDAPGSDTTAEETTEEMAEETKEEEKSEEKEEQQEEGEDKEEDLECTPEKMKELMDEIVDLKATIAQLQADKIKAEGDLETMSKQTPAAKKIPLTPTTAKHAVEKKYEDMTNAEKTRHNRGL